MPRRTKAEAEKTKSIIIDAALKEFSARGIGATTLDHVAKSARVTRGAIYWHFKNKIELYEDVLLLSQQPIYSLVEHAKSDSQPAYQRLHGFMTTWLMMLADDAKYRDSFEILLNKTELTAEFAGTIENEKRLTKDVIALFDSLISAGVEDGSLKADVNRRQSSIALYAFLMGLTQSWLFNRRLFNLRKMASDLVSMSLDVIKAD